MKYIKLSDAIPVATIQRAIDGINFADQCDLAGCYQFELRRNLKGVLEWFRSPIYQKELSLTNLPKVEDIEQLQSELEQLRKERKWFITRYTPGCNKCRNRYSPETCIRCMDEYECWELDDAQGE